MQFNVTDIYRIETMNSVYEVKVIEVDGEIFSTAKKMGQGERPRNVQVKGTEYLEKLYIGVSFDVPGVVLTSVVQDYQHFVVSQEPKRRYEGGRVYGLAEGMEVLTKHIIDVAHGRK